MPANVQWLQDFIEIKLFLWIFVSPFLDCANVGSVLMVLLFQFEQLFREWSGFPGFNLLSQQSSEINQCGLVIG